MDQPNAADDHDHVPSDSPSIRDGLPSPDWTRDQLYARAIWEYKLIEKGEKCTPRYWSCGQFLLAVRKDFDPERFKEWLRRSELLNRTRCERSMLIGEAFDKPDGLERISVLEAVALAAELLGRKRRQTTADARARRQLTGIAKTLDKVLDGFTSLRTADGLGWRIATVRQKLALVDTERVALEQRLAQVAPKRRRARKAASRDL